MRRSSQAPSHVARLLTSKHNPPLIIQRGLSMFSVPDFLDRAKKGAGVTSDYALAKALGHTNQANVSGWRNEKSAPDERAILALCALSGDDPHHVAACIFSMRAANDDAAGLWRGLAARLEKGYAEISLLVFLATLCVAVQAEPVRAALPFADDAAPGLYIMLSVACVRFAWRVALLCWRQSRAQGAGRVIVCA